MPKDIDGGPIELSEALELMGRKKAIPAKPEEFARVEFHSIGEGKKEGWLHLMYGKILERASVFIFEPNYHESIRKGMQRQADELNDEVNAYAKSREKIAVREFAEKVKKGLLEEQSIAEKGFVPHQTAVWKWAEKLVDKLAWELTNE